MKVHSVQHEEGFKPIELKIKIENLDELKYLWLLFYSDDPMVDLYERKQEGSGYLREFNHLFPVLECHEVDKLMEDNSFTVWNFLDNHLRGDCGIDWSK